MIQKRNNTAKLGLRMNSKKEGWLCYQSSPRLSKYSFKGHLTISDTFTSYFSSFEAGTVEFSSKGASTIILGVVNVIANELKWLHLHLKWVLSRLEKEQPVDDQLSESVSQ